MAFDDDGNLCQPSTGRRTTAIPRTRIDRDALRNARELRRAIGREIRQAREDLGISLSRLAEMAGTTKGYLHQIEAGERAASVEMLARISAALGGRLGVRVEPGTGPVVRDHIQAAMIQATVAELHQRWRRFLEVAVHRPVRGVIDLVLNDPAEGVVIAGEAQSQMHRVEQQLRWSGAKADALLVGGSEVGAVIGQVANDASSQSRGISRLLLLRSTRANREVVATYRDLFAATYPASHADAIAALTGTAAWPGSAIVWLDVTADVGRILTREPRGL
jgi:transcriptional regulator with XRE-family HTH domain